MKRPINAALATALLIALAMAIPAAAQPPQDTADSVDADQATDMADMADAPLSEDETEWQGTTDESEFVAVDSTEDAPPDDLSDATIAEENDITATEGSASESEPLKSKMKRMLIGVLMPAVERRVREAVGNDDEPELETESEP